MKGLKTLLLILGPGILWTTLAIGETDLALLPYAGSLFGMSVLWIIVLVHVLYYPNFEYGQRYAVATGESLLDGYVKIKLGKPILWFFLVVSLVTPPLEMASLGGLTGSALYAAFPQVGFTIWCLIAFSFTLPLVLSSRYKVIERVAKVLIFIIVIIALFAFFTSPPHPHDVIGGLRPNFVASAAFMFIVVAVLRMPTDPIVSIFVSKWAQEKRREWGDEKHVLASSLKKSIFDMRIGFIASFFVAVVFLSLGATVLKPLGIVPENIDISVKLGQIYTHSFGPWIFPIFIIAAFAAFWGTYLSAMDGIFRLCGNVIEHLFKTAPRQTRIISSIYIILVSLTGIVTATIVRKPVVLMLLAVSMGLVYYPVIFGMNIYCVTRLVDKEFRPGALNVAVAVLGFLLGIGALVLLLLVRVFKVFG